VPGFGSGSAAVRRHWLRLQLGPQCSEIGHKDFAVHEQPPLGRKRPALLECHTNFARRSAAVAGTVVADNVVGLAVPGLEVAPVAAVAAVAVGTPEETPGLLAEHVRSGIVNPAKWPADILAEYAAVVAGSAAAVREAADCKPAEVLRTALERHEQVAGSRPEAGAAQEEPAGPAALDTRSQND